MSKKRRGDLVFYIVLFLFSLNIINIVYAQADPFGCCTNSGAGDRACSTERLVRRDAECCPKPETNFTDYYKSPQNPFGPSNYNECASKFFFPNTACSSQIALCTLGCCCSELGGTISPEAKCKATGLTFYKGQTDCSKVCAVPQCNDGVDNDNNGCADFNGGDIGCANSADNTESGGGCSAQGAGCSDPNYAPKLSNLEITPIKGQKKFLLNWRDECSQTSISYDISRCTGNGCTNFEIITTTNTNSFEDASAELQFDSIYTYKVEAHYSLQSATPTINKSAMLGNIGCLGRQSANPFCLNNIAYSCDTANRLQRLQKCAENKVCVIDNNRASCLDRSNCNYNNANPFGLFYTLQGCEANRYCFYDKSHSTVNSCFSCDPSMACYDYKTEDACTRDNCKIGSCKWKNLASTIGVGVCSSTVESNCKWCNKRGTPTLENLRAYNEIFDLCTEQKSDLLSEGEFKCYFNNFESKDCSEVTCADYDPEKCSASPITHDENNKITNPSADKCGIKVCQRINNKCAKNADGDDKADCDEQSCETDYFAPNTTMLQVIKKGRIDSLIIQIYDKTSFKSSASLKASQDYETFLCVEPCAQQGHPYIKSTKSRKIIISGLSAFDGDDGSKILALNEGANVIRYYSQDSSKNLEEVKKITIGVYSNSSGPKINAVNITNGSKVQDKLYTSNQKPSIYVEFFDPAIITLSRLVSKDKTRIINLQGGTGLSRTFSLPAAEPLANGEYAFELDAKDKNNIFMEPALLTSVVIDNIKPILNIMPSKNEVIDSPLTTIKLAFDEEARLLAVKINSEDAKNLFSTTDNRIFTSTMNLSDGNKRIDVAAEDFAKNQVTASSEFIVDAYETKISMLNPKFGVAAKQVFDITIGTDNNAVCRYSLDDDFEFEFMDLFTSTNSTIHTIANFNKIPSSDTKIHKLNVKCKDTRGISSKSFDISVNPTPPQLKNAFAFPNPIVEKPSVTTLTVETAEPVMCKFSNTAKEFDGMEKKFEGFDENIFRNINRQNITLNSEGTFVYYVACKNRAELNSDIKEIPVKVDLAIPIKIISHTPEYFNSTNAVLAVETNKRSQCKFSETDQTVQNGEVFGISGYSHTKQLSLVAGKHKFYVICKDQYLQKFSDIEAVTFTIDLTPPIVLSVDDSSNVPGKPELAWGTSSLRLKWNSIDEESKVSANFYSLVDASTSQVILNPTASSLNNEYIIVTNANGSSLNLINGNKYFFRVQAQNVLGLLSDVKESDGITIDTSLKPANCTNSMQDSEETDVDCGNGCDSCEPSKKCSSNTDCRSNFCNNGLCSIARCDDNAKNQEESDVDCGGPCTKCSNDLGCKSNSDCQSGFCSFGTCKPQETCSDGILTPNEADVDCGGPCPAKCNEGNACTANEDCGYDTQCIYSTCKKSVSSEIEQPVITDTDGDGMPDDWEIQNGLNPNDPNDAELDNDNDDITNLEEYNLIKTYGRSTDPNNPDTDGDDFSDKIEIDKGTNPLDPEDYTKTSGIKIVLFIAAFVVLLSGFGYLAYVAIQKRREREFGLPRQREMPQRRIQPMIPQQQPRQVLPQIGEGARVGEAIKKLQEQKEIERKRLFEAFGKEDSNASEFRSKRTRSQLTEKPKAEEKEVKKEKKTEERKKDKKEFVEIKAKKKQKIRFKKPKEDVFIKLREIAKEAKKKSGKSKNATK